MGSPYSLSFFILLFLAPGLWPVPLCLTSWATSCFCSLHYLAPCPPSILGAATGPHLVGYRIGGVEARAWEAFDLEGRWGCGTDLGSGSDLRGKPPVLLSFLGLGAAM